MNAKLTIFLILSMFILGISCVSAADVNNTHVMDSNSLADGSLNVEHPLESVDKDVVDSTVSQSSQTNVSGTATDVPANVSLNPIETPANVSNQSGNVSSNVSELTNNTKNVSGNVSEPANNTRNVSVPTLDIKGPKNESSLNIWGPYVDTGSQGSFDDLQVEINNAVSGGTLYLHRDYKGHYGSRIHLNKDLIIDGMGHTLNCAGLKGCSAFYSEKGTIILKNLRIINGHNDYTDKGGAIYINGSAKYTLDNCVFERNWADDYGGAIYNGVDKVLTIRNCIFRGNTADDDDGGAIFSKGVLDVENTIFEGNKADDYGGAIDIESDKKSTFKNCHFESNTAGDNNGGGIFSKGELDIVNSTFDSNKAYCDGGAVFSKKDVNVFGSVFKNNVAEGATFAQCYGGAICSKGTVNIENSTFDKNTAHDFGGAVYAKNVNVNQKQSLPSFFTNNVAKNNDGGALYTDENVVISNSKLLGNTAYEDGGAINCWDATTKGCEFAFNNATGATVKCYGGAILARGSVNLYDSSFHNNFAYNHGGAIATQYVNICGGAHTYFYDNVAKKGTGSLTICEGGACYNEDDDAYEGELWAIVDG